MEVMAAAVPGGLGGGDQSRRRSRKIVEGEIEEWRLDQPRDEVAGAEPATDPRGAPAGKENVSSCLKKLFGDLAPGLSAADHQDLPGRQRGRVAVLFRVDRV